MSYREKVGAAPQEEGKKIGPPMPCSLCGVVTAHETLCILGARCVPCFRNYKNAVHEYPDVGDRRKGPLEWAQALRRREQLGERLTHPQRKAWRQALRVGEKEAA